MGNRLFHRISIFFPAVFIGVVLFLFFMSRDGVSAFSLGDFIKPKTDLSASTHAIILKSKAFQSASDAAGKQRILDDLKTEASKRQQAMLEAAQTDAMSVLKTAIPNNVKSQLPTHIWSYIEDDVTKEGIFEWVESDDFDNKKSASDFYLTDKGFRYKLYFAKKDPGVVTGTKLKVRGVKINSTIVVQAEKSSTEVLGVTTPPSINKKLAVIMFNFQNDTSIPKTKAALQGEVQIMNNNFKEMLFGNISFYGSLDPAFPDADFFGWYTIPLTNSTCDWDAWTTSAYTTAVSRGAAVSGYDSYLYLTPIPPSCPYKGISQLGGMKAMVLVHPNDPSPYLAIVMSHEMGHVVSLFHASAYNCTDINGVRVPISTTCVREEYGDPFDIMGARTIAQHFNNFHKGHLNTLKPENTLTVTKSGTYTLWPIEKTSSSVQSLRIPRTVDAAGSISSYYYVERRIPYGIDTFTPADAVYNGIGIRLGPVYSVIERTFLIDPTSTTTTFTDAPLQLNKTFTDPAYGISITPLSFVADAQATVQITLSPGACVHNAPTVTVSPVAQWGNPGSTLSYAVTVTNNDNAACASGSFTLNSLYQNVSGLPPGWTMSPSPLTLTLAPRSTAAKTFSLTSGATADGLYEIGLTTQGKTVLFNYNVYPKATPTPSPTPTPAVKPGDANGDLKVDEADYGIWKNNFGQTVYGGPPYGDFNNNKMTDGIDYSIWVTNYGL